MTVYRLRDAAARNKDFMLVKFIKPQPTFLGEPILVTGDGRATEDRPGVHHSHLLIRQF